MSSIKKNKLIKNIKQTKIVYKDYTMVNLVLDDLLEDINNGDFDEV